MRSTMLWVLLAGLLAGPLQAPATITAAGAPAELIVRVAGDRSVRLTLTPVELGGEIPSNPAIALQPESEPGAEPVLRLREIGDPVHVDAGELRVEVRPRLLSVLVSRGDGSVVQEIVFEADGSASFALDAAPVLGLGEGGPRPDPDTPWRQQPVELDRRGRLARMEPRWQSDMYGSRNPVPMLFGTSGWGLFVGAPWVQVDLRDPDRGRFLPMEPPSDTPQDHDNQQASLGKGLPPADAHVPGLFDLFVLDALDPVAALGDFARITGPAALPPRWALGYMQSHRTLEDETQLLEIVDSFRDKRIPLDAVIYLGTGFAPVGWNTEQPSFEFNPEVFRRDPAEVVADLHERNVKVVVHMVPWDRDRLPTLHGTIPPQPGEAIDDSHILSYWQQHLGLIEAGIDAFWPDEGDWFDLHERLKRHQMYYQGPLSARPDVRPWHLERNGYPGIAQWGGWVWSGDTDSAWKTLEAQIAVGLNFSVSLSPFWGSDIGGFYPSSELTGELYARWFQFGAFCASFRSHGRVWWSRLPWGWGLSERGPQEYGNRNEPIPDDDPRKILASEYGNPEIEPIARRYAELRYELLPYTYTLAWQAREQGLPLMRPMWLHYPDDERARGLGTQYLWGRDLLIAPVIEPGATSRAVYLPAGSWYDWWTGETLAGGGEVERPVDLATMPILARAGAIIPVDPVRQHTGEPVDEPTTIRVYRGADGDFTLYDDDGISQEYLQGRGSWTRFTWDDDANRLGIEPAAPEDAAETGSPRRFRIRILPDGATGELLYQGTRIEAAYPSADSAPLTDG